MCIKIIVKKKEVKNYYDLFPKFKNNAGLNYFKLIKLDFEMIQNFININDEYKLFNWSECELL